MAMRAWQGRNRRAKSRKETVAPRREPFRFGASWYRPDRLASPPLTALPVRALTPADGWCDDPADPAYNRPITLPYPASHEQLWRDDGVYDVIVVLGHNDDPPVPGSGSAIFMHVARSGYVGTEGCIALALPDLLAVLADCGPSSTISVPEP